MRETMPSLLAQRSHPWAGALSPGRFVGFAFSL